MSTHTPGPWLIAGDREDFVYALVPNPADRRPGRPESINSFSLRVQSDNGIASEDEIRANAHLIAAAPDLLAAGIQIRNVLGRLVMAVIMGHKIGEEMEAAVNKAQDAMNAAIARAEGKGQAA